MQNKIIFREMLGEIKELADQKGNRLTKEEVKEFFANAHLEEEQMELIYEYLNSQKIKVEGYVPVTGTAQAKEKGEEAQKKAQTESASKDKDEQEERVNVLQMYLDELEELTPVAEQEELKLFLDAIGGSHEAKNRIVMQYLNMVYELSMTYVGAELPQEDLIQEGNLGLLAALDQMKPQENLADYRSILFGAVQDAMESALELSQDTREMDEEIAGRVNHLNEAILNLEQDLGHKVSAEELSVYLEMPVKEIEDILRMAGDEMKEK